MATNHTTNYNLNLWELTDAFVREEFNENTTKIDAALKAEATARTSAINSLTQTVNTKARIAAGHYTGDGAATRTISVGFTPKAVLLMNAAGQTYASGSSGVSYSYVYSGLAVEGSDMTSIAQEPPMKIASGGFQVFCKVFSSSNLWIATNYANMTYNYIALG